MCTRNEEKDEEKIKTLNEDLWIEPFYWENFRWCFCAIYFQYTHWQTFPILSCQ
jgi:hypothetical protein